MEPSFVHLRVHSEYSLIDGLLRIKPLVKAIAGAGMPAVAVTDQVNLFALVRFYKAALGAGVKPIAGVDLWLRNDADANKPYRLTLLVQNRTGYLNLTRLISRAYQEGQHLGLPQVERAWVAAAADGLIALSGGVEGDVAHALFVGNGAEAERLAQDWVGLFGDRYYLELTRTGRELENECCEASVDLAARLGIPVVATNDVRFLRPEDYQAHETRVCIREGRTLDDPRRPHRYSEQQYLRSPEEMAELFADIPEALENSVEIARRCNLELTLGQPRLPDFPVPEGMTPDAFFIAESRKGLEQRLARILDPKAPDFGGRRKIYDERLAIELDVIIQMGFPGYFLIVADFIQWAKDNAIPVGPGRGSGAGSLVAYALKITDLDPIEHELLFERFLNPERVSMPDFDIDFCMEKRDLVIDYVARRYGRDAVSQIITFGTMAAKAVVRDVGRVMGHPYGFVDRIAKLVPFELGMTLKKALAESEDLKRAYDEDEEVAALIDMAMKLEGLARNAGKHAGGVVIAPTVLTDFAPLYCEPGGEGLVTQFDKDDVEAAGLVKFDFLGLRTLTIIDWALATINADRISAGEAPLDIAEIPMGDPEAFALLQRCETTAVFQLESRGMKDLIKKMKPDSFDDMTALVALFRPGPLGSGMVDDFNNRKHGRADVAYSHPDLEPILKPTYGVILYQEQVMQIAQVLAGYSLGGADLLRRAMGKKKAEEMAKQRATFLEGSVARGVDAGVANYIFDLMEKFAGYGFNKTLHRLTKIRTTTGDKHIEDCRAGDVVFSMNPDGSIVQSTVLALHDHGQVPLWLVEFDDGTREQCTLDHKWLTDAGQIPLWKILRMDYQVWGTSPAEARYFNAPETMSNLHEPNPLRTERRQGDGDVLRDNHQNAQEATSAFSDMLDLSGKTSRHSHTNVQRPGSHRANARKVFANRKKNIATFRCSAGTCQAIETLARSTSRRICRHSSQGPCLTQTLENGKLARAAFARKRFCAQCAFALRSGENCQASRFRVQGAKNRDRNRWPMAFLAYSFNTTITHCSKTRPHVASRNDDTQLAADSFVDGMLQRQYGRTAHAEPEHAIRENRRCELARDLVFRQPVRATFVGWHQGYDLEVSHPQHNFLLTSGLCCSNSHSAAYALVSYQTLWLKAYYPAAFMAAVLSADMDNTDKVVTLIDECRAMGIEVQPPAINQSAFRFTVGKDGSVIYGLGAIKGVGESAIEAMLAARNKDGPFADLWDFCRRIDLHKANRRVLEAMIRAGALDGLGANRATLSAQLPLALKLAEQDRESAAAGQVDLFGALEPVTQTAPDPQVIGDVRPEWGEEQRLQGEKETLGLYLTGHPINRFDGEIGSIVSARIAPLLEAGKDRNDREPRTVAGLVVSVRHGKTSKGRMGSVVLDDRTGRIEMAVFNNVYEQMRDLLVPDRILVATGAFTYDEYRENWSLRADRVRTLEDARGELASCLDLTLDFGTPETQAVATARLDELETVLGAFRGGNLLVQIDYIRPGSRGRLRLGPAWRVQPRDELLKRLRQLLGPEAVQVVYGKPIASARSPEPQQKAPRLTLVR